MSNLTNLKPRLAAIPQRLRTDQGDRQVTRAMNTNAAAWKRIRAWVLIRDCYTCQHCKRLVGGKGEAHVDHIDGDDSNNPDDGSNWQTLCRPCHSKKTVAENAGFGRVPAWVRNQAGGG